MARVSGGVSGSSTGGGTAPTGTGVRYMTDGTEDTEAKDISVIQVIQDLLSSAAEGRLDLTTAGDGSSISWPEGKRISLVNSSGTLDLITPTSAISFTNTALDINSTALAGGTTPYAVYLEHNGTTTGADVVLVPWTDATTRSVELVDWLGFNVYDLTDEGKTRRHIGDVLPRIHWNPAAAWSNTTTYVIGEKCTEGGHTFVSLKSGNLNHATSDTAWWQDCGVSPGDSRGVFADERQFRLICNAYNKRERMLGRLCPYTDTANETLPGGSTLRPAMIDGNGNSAWKVEFLADGESHASLIFGGFTPQGSYAAGGIAIDATNSYAPASEAKALQASNSLNLVWVDTLEPGYHYGVPVLESSGTPIMHYWQVYDNIQQARALILGTWRG